MNNQYDELTYYDLTCGSLREHLIPLDEFLKNVSILESCGPLKVSVKDLGNAAKRKRYMVAPYAYKEPVWQVLCKTGALSRNFIQETPEREVIERWNTMVRMRVNRYLSHVVSEQRVGELDRDADAGILLSSTTGMIAAFSWYEFLRAEVIVMPICVHSEIINNHPDTFDGTFEEYKEIQKTAYQLARAQQCYITLRMHNTEGDSLTIDCTEVRPLSVQQVDMFQNYMLEATKSHSKVLMLP